jgi:hypothetical protein
VIDEVLTTESDVVLDSTDDVPYLFRLVNEVCVVEGEYVYNSVPICPGFRARDENRASVFAFAIRLV